MVRVVVLLATWWELGGGPSTTIGVDGCPPGALPAGLARFLFSLFVFIFYIWLALVLFAESVHFDSPCRVLCTPERTAAPLTTTSLFLALFSLRSRFPALSSPAST